MRLFRERLPSKTVESAGDWLDTDESNRELMVQVTSVNDIVKFQRLAVRIPL